MLGPISRISNRLGRNVMTNFVRNHGGAGDNGGIPGENLPFPIHNKYMFTLLFMTYIGSGFSVPFLITRYQLLKQSR